MKATEILDALRTAGVELWLEGDRVRYRCPPGALTAELRHLAADHRHALAALLHQGPRPCSACGERAPAMLVMEPGADGVPWYLCAACWQGSALNGRW